MSGREDVGSRLGRSMASAVIVNISNLKSSIFTPFFPPPSPDLLDRYMAQDKVSRSTRSVDKAQKECRRSARLQFHYI